MIRAVPWITTLLSLLASCAGRDSEQILREMKDEMEGVTLTKSVEGIFFLATDGDEHMLARSVQTVRHVFAALSRDFFSRKPTRTLKIYLLKDKASYDRFCRKRLDGNPSTPYGFYLSSDRTMILNISTGMGTLAHELVHPLLEEDFPGTPSWFNEGFASLYEQADWTREGSIRGLINWRLPALQHTIRRRQGDTLERLLKRVGDDFYADSTGLHYAMARYLCLYLQEQGLLKTYYREFLVHVRKDPTGSTTLEWVTGKKLDVLEREWKNWILTLTYEE